MRLRGTAVLWAALALTASGCGGNSDGDADASAGGGSAVTLDDLRSAEQCPLEPDGSSLPDGVTLASPADASADDYDGEGVSVLCDLTPAEASDDEEVEALLVAAPEGTDVATMTTDTGGSWLNTAYNSTGVAKDDIVDAASGLADDQVEVLEGNGQSLAVTRLSVEGADHAFLLVYGGAGRSADDLTAVAEALRSPAQS